MSNEKSLRHITVPSPCLADWEQMTGNDQVRYCEHCDLTVHNISELTYSRAARLVARSNGRLCVRYYRDSEGGVLTKQPPGKLHKIGRRVSRLAAGTFSAAMSLSTAVAQPVSSLPANNSSVARVQSDDSDSTSSIVGTITDPNGAVIPGATVSISNDAGLSLSTSTATDGSFRFDSLPAGVYSLKAEAPGFATSLITGVNIQNDAEARLDRTLRVAGIEAEVDVESTQVVELGGVVAYVAPEDPFIKAAQEDNILEVQELLPGKNVNLRDKRSGTTALEHAVKNANREMVQLLLSAGADVNARNEGGQTVLMMIGEEATEDLVWDLLNAGAGVNQKDNEGNTPLIEAASNNNLDALKTLLDAGADVSSKNNEGETPLIMASLTGLVNNVRVLVLAGAEINQCDAGGKSALSWAIENRHAPVVRLLRAQGAMEITVAQVAEEN